MSTLSSLTKWDARFLAMAHLVADWSKDPDTKVGAVFVLGNRVLVTGYNGIPPHVRDLPERMTREDGEKYHWMEHAERAAIFDAARRGIPLSGATLYVTRTPCHNCARAAIAVGIQRVVHPPFEEDCARSGDSYTRAAVMFNEAGVQVHTVKPEETPCY